MVILICILVFVVLIVFGAGSVMDSYADAKQAQAAVETAKTSQILAVNQVITTVALIVVIVVLFVLLAAVLFFMTHRKMALPSGPRRERMTKSQVRLLTSNESLSDEEAEFFEDLVKWR